MSGGVGKCQFHGILFIGIAVSTYCLTCICDEREREREMTRSSARNQHSQNRNQEDALIRYLHPRLTLRGAKSIVLFPGRSAGDWAGECRNDTHGSNVQFLTQVGRLHWAESIGPKQWWHEALSDLRKHTVQIRPLACI